MKAMILAAGRGERMKPLSEHTPKPLLKVRGKPLIEYHLEALTQIGCQQVVINIAHLPNRFYETLGDGSRFGLSIIYSHERDGALETGGGIVKALPLLGPDPFIVVNGDIWTDYPFETLLTSKLADAHVVLVSNPPHHPLGDYAISEGVLSLGTPRFTMSGIGVYACSFFRGQTPQKFSLSTLLTQAAKSDSSSKVTAELYTGVWHDVGTLERLKEITL